MGQTSVLTQRTAWMIGYVKIGAVFVGILAFAIISCFLFFVSK
jgi:hypothetical protein